MWIAAMIACILTDFAIIAIYTGGDMPKSPISVITAIFVSVWQIFILPVLMWIEYRVHNDTISN